MRIQLLLTGVMLVVLVTVASGQGTFTNTGTITNTGTMTITNFTNTTGRVDNSAGTILVKGSLANTTADSFDTRTGTVEYTGASAAQTIISSVKSATYGNLAGRNGGTKTLGGNITVSGTVTSDGASTTVDVSTFTLTVPGATPIVSSNSGSFTAASGTVNYNGDVDQSVFGTSYATLITSGASVSRTKTASGNVTVTSALTNGTNVTLDFGTNSFTGTGATFTNNNVLRSAGSVSLTTGVSIGGTFEFYASTGSQSIPEASFVNLTLSGGTGATGQKNLSSGTTSVSGTYTVSGASRNYSTGTFQYNGSSQSVVGESYKNLTLTGTGLSDVKTAAANVTVNGNFLNTLGTARMQTFTLAISGTKTNTGKIQFAGLSNGVVFSDGTVEYNGTTTDAASQTITAGTYNTLIFSNDAPKNVGSSTTVRTTSNLTINPGVTANNQGTLQIDNDLSNAGSVNNSGTLQVGN